MKKVYSQSGMNDKGSRDGAVIRALASHQCGLGLILRLSLIWWLSLLLVLILALRGFSLGSLVFPSPKKNSIYKFQFNLESEVHRFVSHNRLSNCITQSWFIYISATILLHIRAAQGEFHTLSDGRISIPETFLALQKKWRLKEDVMIISGLQDPKSWQKFYKTCFVSKTFHHPWNCQ